MTKLIGLVIAVMFLLAAVNPDREKFAKYKTVEAYEIRPGILMMPRYSAGGEVCEIGLEKLHYSPEKIRVDSDLSRQEISQIFDELVPSAERGPKPTSLLESGMTTVSGRGMINDEEYQNVSIRIFGSFSPADGKDAGTLDEVAATLTWKNRKCQ
jgi:hypothetical protein